MSKKISKILVFLIILGVFIIFKPIDSFAAKQIKMSATTVKLTKSTFTYTGESITPIVTVTYKGKKLSKGRDYTLSFSNNKNAGTGKVTVKGKGEYTGSVTKKFTIKPLPLKNNATVTLSKYEYTYNGGEQEPIVYVKTNKGKRLYGDSIKITYPKDSKNAGSKLIVINGRGNYTGSLTVRYYINKCSIKNLKMEVYDEKNIYYKGAAWKPPVRMYLTSTYYYLCYGDNNFKLNYSNNTNAGTATIKIEGKGNYTGTVKKTFKIKQRDISKCVINPINAKYTGKPIEVKVQYNFSKLVTLKSGTDYKATYSKNVNPGTAKVTITGRGNYAGTITKTFTIYK